MMEDDRDSDPPFSDSPLLSPRQWIRTDSTTEEWNFTPLLPKAGLASPNIDFPGTPDVSITSKNGAHASPFDLEVKTSTPKRRTLVVSTPPRNTLDQKSSFEDVLHSLRQQVEALERIIDNFTQPRTNFTRSRAASFTHSVSNNGRLKVREEPGVMSFVQQSMNGSGGLHFSFSVKDNETPCDVEEFGFYGDEDVVLESQAEDNMYFLPDGALRKLLDILYHVLVLLEFAIIVLSFVNDSFNRSGPNGLSLLVFLGWLVFQLVSIPTLFRTAYLDKWALVTGASEMKQHYLSTWFWFDAITAIPYDLLASLAKPSLFWPFATFRVVHFLRIPGLFKQSSPLRSGSNMHSIIRGLVVYVVFLHLLTCMWGALELGNAEPSTLRWWRTEGFTFTRNVATNNMTVDCCYDGYLRANVPIHKGALWEMIPLASRDVIGAGAALDANMSQLAFMWYSNGTVATNVKADIDHVEPFGPGDLLRFVFLEDKMLQIKANRTVVGHIFLPDFSLHPLAYLPARGDSMAVRRDEPSPPSSEVYIASLYFILVSMTTVGYGSDATTTDGYAFCVVLMLVGATLYAMFQQKLKGMLEEKGLVVKERGRIKNVLATIMDRHAVPTFLQKEVFKVFASVYDNPFSLMERENFPPYLQQLLMQHFRLSLLRSVPLFDGLGENCIRDIAKCMTVVLVPPDTVIVREGERGTKMLVVSRGLIKITKKGNGALPPEEDIPYMREGDRLGEKSLSSEFYHNYTATTITKVEVLALSRAAFCSLQSTYPHLAQRASQKRRRSVRFRSSANFNTI